MIETLQILAGFLEKYSDDVEGRSLEEPSTELRGQFRDFARGALESAERARLSQMLKDNPHWIPALAEEARTPRAPRS